MVQIHLPQPEKTMKTNLINIDCSVVCEQPKLAPHVPQMVRNLSTAAGGPVSVKGRRAEGLGPIGAREGLVVFASALVVAR